MIKFFRKIRQNLILQNKTGKYFKYAVGEIVLVVIGILIALSINNWNENQKNKSLENTYLERLEEETKWNIKQLEYNISQYLESATELNNIIDYIEKGNKKSKFLKLNRPNYIHPWIIKSSTYNELVSTGDLKIIRDVPLRELLDEANSFVYFSEQQLENWRRFAISHEQYFVPFKKNKKEIDKNNMTYYVTGLDYDKMMENSTMIELLKHWSLGNMVFYDGVTALQDHYKKILERLKCIKENQKCKITSKDIIKN